MTVALWARPDRIVDAIRRSRNFALFLRQNRSQLVLLGCYANHDGWPLPRPLVQSWTPVPVNSPLVALRFRRWPQFVPSGER
jgi:hypothetical protein